MPIPTPPQVQGLKVELNPDGSQVILHIAFAAQHGYDAYMLGVPMNADDATLIGGHLLAKAGAVYAKPASGIVAVTGLNGFSKAE